MIKTVFVLIFTLLCYSYSYAQVPVTKAGKLTWQWQKGVPPNDGDVAEFVLRCGKTSGNYTLEVVVANPLAREFSLKDALVGDIWFCVVHARNPSGISAPSNEVHFKVISPVLSAPSNLKPEG